jgi:hypothetical protein
MVYLVSFILAISLVINIPRYGASNISTIEAALGRLPTEAEQAGGAEKR